MSARVIGFEEGKKASTAKPVARKRRTGRLKVPDNGTVITAEFSSHLPGEMAVAFELALKELKLECSEVPTPVEMGGFIMGQRAFSRREVDVPGGEKLSIGWGSYEVGALGRTCTRFGDSATGMLSLTPIKDEWDEDLWAKLVETTRMFLAQVRIYRGHALEMRGAMDTVFPHYLDLSRGVDLFLNDRVQRRLDEALFDVIRMRKELRAAGVKTKRGIAMSGHYGVGKTTTAMATAKICVAHDTTFFTIGTGYIQEGMSVMKILQPAVMFVEDLDSVTHGDRDRLNGLLNVLSGMTSREQDTIIIVSTNFVDRIDPGFLRPDRIDTIIELELPDDVTVQKIIRASAGEFMSAEEDLAEVGAYWKGATPAILLEAVTLCKIRCVREKRKITSLDLLSVGPDLEKQRMLAAPRLVEDTNAIKMEQAAIQAVKQGYRDAYN